MTDGTSTAYPPEELVEASWRWWVDRTLPFGGGVLEHARVILRGGEERTGDYGAYPYVVLELVEPTALTVVPVGDGRTPPKRTELTAGELVGLSCFGTILPAEWAAAEPRIGGRYVIGYYGVRKRDKPGYANPVIWKVRPEGGGLSFGR